MDSEPWDFHPDLKRERLIALAARLLLARNEVLDRREPENGDDAYATGTRAFSWQCEAIRQMAAEDEYSWLTLAKSNQEFVFRIGAVPARFYRGEHDRPNSRTMRQTFHELKQDRLPLGDDRFTSSDLIWRFAIETFHDGEVQRIVFCGFVAATSTPVCIWEVPLDYADGVGFGDLPSPIDLDSGNFADWTTDGDDVPAPELPQREMEIKSEEESE